MKQTQKCTFKKNLVKISRTHIFFSSKADFFMYEVV